MTAFGHLHHIGIVVNELEPASRNITALLEARVSDRGVDEPLGASWIWVESPRNPVIELRAPTRDGAIADWLARRGQGLHHLIMQTSIGPPCFAKLSMTTRRRRCATSYRTSA